MSDQTTTHDPGFVMDPEEEGITESPAKALPRVAATESPSDAERVQANDEHKAKVEAGVARATTAKPKFRGQPLYPANDFTIMMFQDITEAKRSNLWMNAVFLWLSLQPRKKLMSLYGNSTSSLMKAVVAWMDKEKINDKALEPVLETLENIMADATAAQVEPDDDDEGNG